MKARLAAGLFATLFALSAAPASAGPPGSSTSGAGASTAKAPPSAKKGADRAAVKAPSGRTAKPAAQPAATPGKGKPGRRARPPFVKSASAATTAAVKRPAGTTTAAVKRPAGTTTAVKRPAGTTTTAAHVEIVPDLATAPRASRATVQASLVTTDAPATASPKFVLKATLDPSAGPASTSVTATGASVRSSPATSLNTMHPATAGAEDAPPPAAPNRVDPLKGSRFLASGVPLAEVQKGRFRAAGTAKKPCGTKARWARARSRWHALDAWGRVTGTLTIGGSERDTGTGCHQVHFNEGTGRDGLGVFVAEGSGYAAGASAEWRADAENKKRFDRLYLAQERAWTEGKTAAGAARRTMFFRLPAQEAAAEGSPTQQRPERWAVSGGRVLVIAYVGAAGSWKVGHVLPPNGKIDAYEPLAVLDMNGDGLPEIVVHEEAGGVFTDRVLSFDPASMRWETAVESPGGATR